MGPATVASIDFGSYFVEGPYVVLYMLGVTFCVFFSVCIEVVGGLSVLHGDSSGGAVVALFHAWGTIWWSAGHFCGEIVV